MNLLWSRIYDLIIKTLLCSENYIVQSMKKYNCNRTNCYELLGFDVLIGFVDTLENELDSLTNVKVARLRW